MLAIKQTLLDQLDNNDLIKLELANKQDDNNNNSINEYKINLNNKTIS